MQYVLEKPILKNIVLSWLICGLGAIYYCYEYFLRVMPSVMMPEIMGAYDLTGAQVGNLAGCYYHAYTPMQLAVGLLMDRYGPRRLLTLACGLSAMGACLFASGHSLLVAEAGRFLIGFGAAFAFVGALKLVTVWLPPHRFALASGLIMFLGTVGAMVGDILLRTSVDALGWQETIYISAAAGVVLAVLLWISVRDTNPYSTHTDTHTVDFKAVLLGLWGSIKNSQIWLAGIVGFLLYLSLSAFAELWGIPYLEQARGLSKTDASTANSLIFLGGHWLRILGLVLRLYSKTLPTHDSRLRRRRCPSLHSSLCSQSLSIFSLHRIIPIRIPIRRPNPRLCHQPRIKPC